MIFRRVIFYILSFTWGIVMTSIGLVVTIVLLPFGKQHIFHGRIYTEIGKGWGGLELGCFFICCKTQSDSLRAHECGHGLQNCLWGPLFPFVIAIPSAIRYWYREIMRKKNPEKFKTLGKYDDIWFEGQATRWGCDYVLTDKI